MTVREVPYDGYAEYEYHRAERPRSLAELLREFNPIDSTDDLKQVATETPVKESVPSTVKSRIRVQLSRPLTWAEVEDLTTDGADPHLRRLDGNGFDGLKLWVAPNHVHVWAEAPYGSRDLYELVASIVANEYVNVFPKAVRTFREYNGE